MPDQARHQRDLLRESLQHLLVHVGMIESWAGLGDLDNTNDGALLMMATDDFIRATPNAKDLLMQGEV